MTQPSKTLQDLLNKFDKPDELALTDQQINGYFKRIKEAAMPKRAPRTPKKVKPDVAHFRGSNAQDLHIHVVSDGTITEVTLHPIDKYTGLPDLSHHYARGIARRRKGETRSASLGVLLASARAFAFLAESYEKRAEDELR